MKTIEQIKQEMLCIVQENKDESIDDIILLLIERKLAWIESIQEEQVKKDWQEFYNKYSRTVEAWNHYKTVIHSLGKTVNV